MSASQPQLSVIVPAYNEEDWLGSTLKSIDQAIDEVSESCEVIVVDNNSDDQTGSIAQNHGAKVVFEPHNQISRARNAGAREARGHSYLFIDADTLISTELLRKILKSSNDHSVVGGGALLEFRENLPGSAKFGLSIWNWISKTFSLAAGSVFWMDAEIFNKTGGFNESFYASEEIWMSLAIKRTITGTKKRFLINEKPKASTSGRKFEHFSTIQLVGGFGMFLLAPWVVFSKRACHWYWYQK